MRVLLIGGTGLISQGIVKHLLLRGDQVSVFNRAQREDSLPSQVKRFVGDRNKPDELARPLKDNSFDVVIDMVCFNPEQAESAVKVFAGKCEQFIFCSTVCTYGVKVPPNIFINETFPQEPISSYGKNKVACEKIFLAAHAANQFKSTIIRPSHTYGPGHPLIDNLEFDAVAWDRIEKGQPVLCAGDGLGLWVSTHRDDCGKLFAHAAVNPVTYGQSYNATHDAHVTWREYYRQAAAALNKQAKLIFMPADWIVRQDAKRFGLLAEITAFHGAYDSSKAKRDVPQFRCEIDLQEGARQTFADVRRRNAWKDSSTDMSYQAMVDRALATGAEPISV
jgi:nucleoside-diphosphate-sugar epimerase